MNMIASRSQAIQPRALRFLFTLLISFAFVSDTTASDMDHVILLHGLCRTSRSMVSLERELSTAGFHVLNVDYPSRAGSIEQLSESVVGQAVRECQRAGAKKVHFVTHSLGGILVRDYLARHTLTNLGHVVMLGPPNHGSEVVDKMGQCWLYWKITGLAGTELGTDTNSSPFKLGAPDHSVGVVSGNRSLNWINSLMIPGRDDGKVSIERTKLAGMADHLVVRATHPFLVRDKTTIRQTINFLRTGRFEPATVSEPGRNASRCPSLANP